MDLRNYGIVTASYWGFTLTDGALRMLVLLHFHTLGYSPVQLAFLFLLYEGCGMVSNLLGGWIGSRLGLKVTLFAGLAIQIVALLMLSFLQPDWAVAMSVGYVMGAQALSGIAKDLTKMSSKSAVKLLVPAGAGADGLFQWVAILTGSKNALKGAGFLFGGILLGWLGFERSLWAMAGALTLILMVGFLWLQGDLGKSTKKVTFTQLFSKSREINILSAARFFLFGSRDLWFVVGLPIFLKDVLGWSFAGVGAFLACWVIGYGMVQALAPQIVRRGGPANGAQAVLSWGFLLLVVTTAMAAAVHFDYHTVGAVLGGLTLFGVVFAVNSAVHSYLILAYTQADEVALNVGFYYMANAGGRLVGTLLSGVLYLAAGLPGCLWASAGFVLVAAFLTILLPRKAENGPGMAQAG
ncbi:MAG: organoarsenical effux MFS transporter ArsJ [Roseibacillus sp.]|nr:organoarsenical effux MFS transporter ArsJ [Roseibacillus sp.]